MSAAERIGDYTDIIVEERGAVAVIKFNRPQRLNAMSTAMMDELIDYLESLNTGEFRIRAVVLTGEGRAFCAGGDVTTFPGANEGKPRPGWRPSHGYRQPTAVGFDCSSNCGPK